MYRRYYSYNNMPSMPARREERKPVEECCEEKGICEVPAEKECAKNSGGIFDGIIQDGKIFGRFELDDVILFVVILVLLMDECDDNLLLIALGFVFISGILQNDKD